MNKYLPLFILSFLTFGLKAQNPCPTCHQGTKGTMIDSLTKLIPMGPHKVGNGNSTLGQSYVLQNVCGLNYTQASILTETRSAIYAFNANGSGFPCSLSIGGLPCGGNGNIEKAYVYYEASYTEPSPPATSVVFTNPVPATTTVAATLIGQAGPKCWGETGTAAYRADVTAEISGNGAYGINLLGFANAAWEVDGVTLIIIYKNPAATYSGSISLWDGCIVEYFLLGAQTYSGINVCASTGTADAFGVFGDIQINVNGGINTDVFNGSTATFPNNFWNFNQIATGATAGQTTCVFNPYTNNGGDCYAWILAGYYWQNTNCLTCTPSVLTLTTTDVEPTCGSNNGSITVTATGGTAPYTYLWNPGGQTTATATGLSAGTYTVTVTSAGGCSSTTAVVTLTSSALTVNANIVQNVLCNGQCNGIANAVITGGTAPFTYAWTPSGGTNATASSLCPGTYTVTVHDHNGCTGTATVTITQPPLLTATTTEVNDKCNGGATGSATVTPAGGTPPYTYLWAPGGQTNATATGLTAGTYTVTVTDNNGCTVQEIITITQPPPMIVNIVGVTNDNCNGGATGSISTSVSGGASPYTYLWSPSGGTGPNGTGLTAGNYTVTVTDNNGCTQTATATITQPTPVTAVATVTSNAPCTGGTGSATVTAGGGTPGYTYLWTPTGGTGQSVGNLSAGTYTVTVTDANGCTATASVTITQPTVVTATISASTNVSCSGGDNGSATVTAGGGTPGYTYVWNPGGQTNATATGLSAGTYTVVVTDANGCTATTTVTIAQPAAVTATITGSTNVSCNGGANGTATVAGGGGTPGYTYLWNPGGQTNATATGLSAGTYTVTVTDADGCTATTTVTIMQPTPVTATITGSVNELCNGGDNGSATAAGGGGTPGYTYLWNPGGNTNANATGLSAGTYTVTVTDANGCTATASVTITQPPLLTATITSSTNVLCNGQNNGSATVTAGGGTPGYRYAWSPSGGTNANATGLSAGTYTVTVFDNDGCTATTTVTITQPAPLTATATFTQASCNLPNGSVTVIPAGGTGPYTYSWNPGGSTNATVTGLSVGTYTATVIDNNGCVTVATVTITQPSAVTATITGSTNVSCNGGANGTATVSASGGTAPYTYLWNPGGNTNATATGLSAGNYTVTVTDNNGCIYTASVTITQPTPVTANITNTVNVLCNGGNNGSSTVTAGGGTPGYTYNWNPNGGTGATGTGLTAGTYTVTVTDANGCTATTSVTITQPTPVTANITASTNVSCNGGNNGSATVAAGGGTPGYTYAWSPSGGNGPSASGLSANTYTVVVTDANGCTATANVTITQPTTLTASITASTNILCNGGTTGTATVSANGGTLPYNYLWTPSGGTGATGTGLSAGNYTVTVTDANGCTASASVTITQPTLLSISITGVTNVTCNGGNDGTATSLASGGTPGYTYIWTPAGGTNATGTGLSTGLYTVTVTDANGCTASISVTIVQPTLLTATTVVNSNVSCNGGANGSATVTALGGTNPYTYLWTPAGGTNAMGTGMSAGTYTITVTDNHGCTATATATITQPAVLTASIIASTGVKCNGQSDGTATAAGAGGTVPYAYSWSPSGGTNAIGTGLSAGLYTVTVTDANGCTASSIATITQPTVLTVSVTSTNISCFGGNDGTASATPAGGTGPYAYLWTPSAESTATATTLTVGTYTVTVTDANGCTATGTATLTEPTRLRVTASGPQSVCSGAPATLISNASGGTAPYAYSWAPAGGTTATTTTNPIVTTTYTITVTDANGCVATASVTVFIGPALSLSFTGNEAVCPGGTISLTAYASGGDGIYSYVWEPSGQTTQNVTFNPTNDTVVTIDLTDGCGSAMLTETIPITVDPLPKISLGSDIMSGCVPLCIQFRNMTTISSGGIAGWGWSFGNGDSSNVESPVFCYQDTGKFSVSLTATSDSGCSSTLKAVNMITVYPPPAANFTYSPQPINILSPLVQFTNQSTGKYPIAEWFWRFGEGDSTSYLQNPEHFYPDTGTFCATLIVTDIHGCVDSITNCLVVNPAFTFYIPDAFTPNGDGLNDVFMPKGTYVKDYEMYIYDRWGMQLFHSTEMTNGWNGMVKGGSTVCQEDTYVYLINVTDAQGIQHSYTGNVNLIK